MSEPRVIWVDGLPYCRVPPLSAGAAEMLQLITAHPGIHLSELARRRRVTPHAAQQMARNLERQGYIRMALVTVPGLHGTVRACYRMEAP